MLLQMQPGSPRAVRRDATTHADETGDHGSGSG